MIKEFAKIRVLIWDFDGTFYKPNQGIYKAVREGEYRTIMHHTGWDHDKTEIEFAKLYPDKFTSATQCTAYLSHISVPEAAVEMEEYFDRRKFLKPDKRLMNLFSKLTDFRHFILANGVVKRHLETLKVLGIPADTFEEIVTSETVRTTKPDPAGFRYILQKTKLSPDRHLMIGDREIIDLVPAKSEGMKTCLVWSESKSAVADLTLPDVYHLSDVLR